MTLVIVRLFKSAIAKFKHFSSSPPIEIPALFLILTLHFMSRLARYFGTRLLHRTVKNKNTSLVRILLWFGADPNHQPLIWNKKREAAEHRVSFRLEKRGDAPLHIAAESGQQDLIGVLVKAGADLNLPNVHGWTPLGLATKRHDKQTISHLIKLGANPNRGQNPLYEAIKSNDHYAILLLMRAGAHIYSCLQEAFYNIGVRMAEICNEQGLDSDNLHDEINRICNSIRFILLYDMTSIKAEQVLTISDDRTSFQHVAAALNQIINPMHYDCIMSSSCVLPAIRKNLAIQSKQLFLMSAPIVERVSNIILHSPADQRKQIMCREIAQHTANVDFTVLVEHNSLSRIEMLDVLKTKVKRGVISKTYSLNGLLTLLDKIVKSATGRDITLPLSLCGVIGEFLAMPSNHVSCTRELVRAQLLKSDTLPLLPEPFVVQYLSQTAQSVTSGTVSAPAQSRTEEKADTKQVASMRGKTINVQRM